MIFLNDDIITNITHQIYSFGKKNFKYYIIIRRKNNMLYLHKSYIFIIKCINDQLLTYYNINKLHLTYTILYNI